MADARGDLLVLYADVHSSGTVEEMIAGTTSYTFSSEAAWLETTDQSDGLNTNGITGKMNRTISGNYILATDADNFNTLYEHQSGGLTVTWTIKANGTTILSGSAKITSLDFTAGTSAELCTGSYSLQVIGTVSTS